MSTNILKNCKQTAAVFPKLEMDHVPNDSNTRPGPEFVDLEFYQQALLGSSIVGLIFLFALLAVCIAFIRVRQKYQNKPEVVKKGKRSRVFSTSSNSGKR